MNSALSPIVLFIYKRPEHTRRTLEALQQNKEAAESVLYVFADGPKAGADNADLEIIEKTRAVVTAQKWCGEVVLVNRPHNMNLEDNVIDGITRVIEKHGSVIVLEDDILTSPFFLKYCNEGLRLYRESPQVFSINAFMFPIDFGAEAGTFLNPLATSSWGWATWADRWACFEKAPQYISALENNWMLRSRFNFGNINHFNMLKYMNTWDLRWYYTAFIRNGLGVFPTRSLTENIGFDGSGTHEDGNKGLIQACYDSPVVHVYQTSVNLDAYDRLLNYFRIIPLSLKQMIKNRIKALIRY
jgi:hypothetical protein